SCRSSTGRWEAAATSRPRGRIHEASATRQDAGGIHRLAPRRSCKDDHDGARAREQAPSARVRRVPRLGHDRLDDPFVPLPRHSQQAAALLRRALVAEELLLAPFDGPCVHFESPDDLPLPAIGKLISAISSEKWIEMYERSRSKTKAGRSSAPI